MPGPDVRGDVAEEGVLRQASGGEEEAVSKSTGASKKILAIR
jgi:hypothetical protein